MEERLVIKKNKILLRSDKRKAVTQEELKQSAEAYQDQNIGHFRGKSKKDEGSDDA